MEWIRDMYNQLDKNVELFNLDLFAFTVLLCDLRSRRLIIRRTSDHHHQQPVPLSGWYDP